MGNSSMAAARRVTFTAASVGGVVAIVVGGGTVLVWVILFVGADDVEVRGVDERDDDMGGVGVCVTGRGRQSMTVNLLDAGDPMKHE